MRCHRVAALPRTQRLGILDYEGKGAIVKKEQHQARKLLMEAECRKKEDKVPSKPKVEEPK